jgi:serine/threonine protein kinase
MSDVSQVEEIFLNAVSRKDPAERVAFLDRQCGPDSELRRRVEVLLAAQSKVGGFLEPQADLTGAYQPKPTKPEATAAVGDRIGPYKLLEKIGEGGMGEVWVADQLEPIKRRVAVKLIKPGMDSRSVLGRFEAERQALAVMDHPNIAKVLDAGTSVDGRPYFVMELVKGTPITEFADARKLTPKQRLELFIPVCQAIQHAHMKGIIHRDIKPSNVLVALHDEMPVPKVIDFGVAKAVGQQLTENTIYTGFGALVGTPTYMAPEQATFNQLDVDTRADVYALGVLLYELLAGSPPIERERLKKAALDEVLRIVRDEEPPRPSARLSTSQAKASIAATRGSEPAKLSALMTGELDWIVMKALEKDRTRRYESANGFAADVQRYLSGEQVQAVPPSLGYRLAKAYRRNRDLVIGIATIATLLVVGAAISGYLAVQARRAEAEAARNADAFQGAMVKTDSALQQLEEVTANRQVDAALLEYKLDPRLGLLQLARSLRTLTPEMHRRYPLEGGGEIVLGAHAEHLAEMKSLREFVTAAVISAGQEYAPLLPPLNPEVSSDYSGTSSPDGSLWLYHDDRGTAALWNPRTATKIATLREQDECVARYGFSPDAKTIYTQDEHSIARFWDTDGTLRAKTPLRPERFVYPPGMTAHSLYFAAEVANPIRVCNGIALLQSEQRVGIDPKGGQAGWRGKSGPKEPVDLYSTQTGKFIRRLDVPGRRLSDWQDSPDGRWLIAIEDSYDAEGRWQPSKGVPQVVVLSATDGKELARLEHSVPKASHLIAKVSPTGKWLLTRHFHGGKESRLWNTTTWQPVFDPAVIEAMARNKPSEFITDNVLSQSWVGDGSGGIGVLEGNVFRLDKPNAATLPFSKLGEEPPVGELNGTYLRSGRILTNAETLLRLKPPQGRKYALELAKIAPDGRFWDDLDTVTEKTLPYNEVGHHFSGFGRVSVRTFNEEFKSAERCYAAPEVRILPDPSKLNIPPALLELWVQVAVAGELGSDGQFQSWDEPTWEAKRQKITAAKPPYSDFPFPGWVVTQPHYWWKAQAKAMGDTSAGDRFHAEWRRRTGRETKVEPDTWRTPGPAQPEPKK